MKKIGTIGIILLILFTLSGCQSIQHLANTQDNWAKIKRNKKVVIGLDDSFVPMGFVRKNGRLVGYDIDLARAVFKLYGIKVNFQTIDWSMNNVELRNGTIDLIWNGYSVTPERKKKVALSLEYLKNYQVLVVKKDSKIKDFTQMKNKNLGMQTGSAAQQWYDGKQKTIRAHSTVLYSQIPNAFLDLKSGRIQGILLDEIYANYYITHMAHRGNYRVITNSSVPADYFAVGIRKGDKTIQQKINAGLRKLQKNGKLAALNKKWFGKKNNYLEQ